ncbi:MAG: hypothetical protein ACI4DW_01825 [Lachnospiraceae bacterium]
MNVNELAGSVYQTHYPSHVVSLPHTGQLSAESTQSAETTAKTDFSDVLASYIDNGEDEELVAAIQELTESIETLKKEASDNSSSDVMSILTDQEKAREYMSSQSGTQLVMEMIENSIAGIISGSSN